MFARDGRNRLGFVCALIVLLVAVIALSGCSNSTGVQRNQLVLKMDDRMEISPVPLSKSFSLDETVLLYEPEWRYDSSLTVTNDSDEVVKFDIFLMIDAPNLNINRLLVATVDGERALSGHPIDGGLFVYTPYKVRLEPGEQRELPVAIRLSDEARVDLTRIEVSARLRIQPIDSFGNYVG